MELEKKILKALSKRKAVSVKQLAIKIGEKKRNVKDMLYLLLSGGKAVRETGGFWKAA